MDSNPKPDGAWLTNQSTYLRLKWMYLCPQPGEWTREWEILAYKAMVQAQDREAGLNSNLPSLPLARRV